MARSFLPVCQVSLVVLFSVPGPIATAGNVPRFETRDIDTKVGIGYGLAIGDVNGDRRPDILLVDKTQVVWYRSPDWKRFVLCEKVTRRDNVCIAAKDIDGDGMVEVAIGGEWNPGDTINSGSVHYLIAPEDRTGRWDVVKLPKEPTVHRMRWALDSSSNHRLIVAPLHGRGNVGGKGDGARTLMYRMPEDSHGTWTTELVDGTLHKLHNLELVNWDGDPEHEVLLAGDEGVFLCDRGKDGWQRRQLVGNEAGERAFEGCSEIRTGVLPGGGKRFLATIEKFHGKKIVIYTPPREGRELWTRRVVDGDLSAAHAVACADLTAAGSDQLLVGWRNRGNSTGKVGVNLYVPLDGDGRRWQRVPIDEDGMACEDIKVADLDGDGRMDVIAAGRSTHNLRVYWNRGIRFQSEN